MAKKKAMIAKSFPVYVWLKSPNPYKGKVRINGIEISSKKTIIETTEKLAMLQPIQAFLNIEPVNSTEEEQSDSAQVLSDTVGSDLPTESRIEIHEN